MTVQDIINSASQDVRAVVQASGNGATLLLDYTDRIHKDCLHSGVYEYLSRSTTTVTTVATTAYYTLTPTTIRHVVAVYDRTTNRVLLPLPAILTPPGNPLEARDAMRVLTGGGYPEFYRTEGGTGSTVLYLFSTPQSALTIEVHYAVQTASLSAATSTLTVPDDGKDMVVAGVNFLTNAYLGRTQEAQIWQTVYQTLKGAPTTLIPGTPQTSA